MRAGTPVAVLTSYQPSLARVIATKQELGFMEHLLIVTYLHTDSDLHKKAGIIPTVQMRKRNCQ